MITTAREICADALVLTQYIGASEKANIESYDADLALNELIALMDAWINEALLYEYKTESSCVLTPNQRIVQIGANLLPANNVIVAERPQYIQNIWTVDASNTTHPLQQVTSTEIWRTWHNDTIQASYPSNAEYVLSYPIGELHLYPLPSQPLTLKIGYDSKPVIPTDLNSVMTLQAGWYQALKYNLASNLLVPLAIPGGETTQLLQGKAEYYKQLLKSAKTRNKPRSIMDSCLLNGRYSSGRGAYGYSVNNDSYNGVR